MKTLDTKKIIIIFAVLFVIVGTAIVLALTNGNVKVPTLSDPNGVFYQRTDDNGNVIYNLTNQELFDQMKTNDGINQLLLMSDKTLLADYINQVTNTEVQDKIKQLTYGTSDDTAIAKLSADVKQKDETQFSQAMVLAGYQNNETEYAKILVAREKYVAQTITDNGEITPLDVANAFVSSYFQDINAIKILFTSHTDALDVMHKFNLAYTSSNTLGTYNGYIYQKESLKDTNGDVIQAYQTVDAYYFDSNSNILNLDGSLLYTLGDTGTYSDTGGAEYRLDTNGNLIDNQSNIIISKDILFQTSEAATQYKADNTTYYTVTRTDPFNETETINVLDSNDNIVFTIDPTTNKIYDASSTDVTDTTTLYVNKQYRSIDSVSSFTTNTTTGLTSQQVLDYYIKMYNYVYGEYRNTLPENSTAANLIALNDSNLQFTYNDLSTTNPNLATYMFSTLSTITDKYYTATPQDITDSTEGFYMVYKLSSPDKLDLVTKAADHIQPTIVIPTQVGGDLTLPTTSYYSSTISWTSSDASIISDTGTFTRPSTDTSVDLTYTLTLFGQAVNGTITVTALASGDTVAVTQPEWTEIPVKDLINDGAAYNTVFDKLLNDMVYGSNSTTTIKNHLITMRQDLGFTINDRFLAWDYQSTDSSYTFNNKGDKRIIAYYDHTLTSDQPYNITADQLFTFAMDKNPALYVVYAAQFKELLNSTYYTQVFGDNKNIKTNSSARMVDMQTAVSNTKGYYEYLKNLYTQYGMTYQYNTYQDYAYKTYSTKSDYALLQHYVVGELQPFLVNSVFSTEDILNQLYSTIQDYYTNYFSLNVSHVLFYVDRNEDGNPDNYTDFIASMSDTELTAYNQKLAALEDSVNSYSGSLSDLVSAYNDATRTDPTWGQFKQMGFHISTENLNVQDSKDKSKYHSLTYTGTYGVNGKYDPGFVTALEDLYTEYQLPQNASATKLDSNLVVSQFGLHRIEVTQGDDFAKPTCQFEEADSANPVYDPASVNTSGMPTMAQVELYAEYKFDSLTYDLTKTDLETKYGITVPKLPATLKTAMDTYVGGILDGLYVIGTVNIGMATNLANGTFTIDSQYSTFNNSDAMGLLANVKDIYFHAMFDSYSITQK